MVVHKSGSEMFEVQAKEPTALATPSSSLSTHPTCPMKQEIPLQLSRAVDTVDDVVDLDTVVRFLVPVVHVQTLRVWRGQPAF